MITDNILLTLKGFNLKSKGSRYIVSAIFSLRGAQDVNSFHHYEEPRLSVDASMSLS